MPQTPRHQPLTSSCALCPETGFADALDLQMHTGAAHFRLTAPEPSDPDLTLSE